jgi:hypothetical protein
MCLCISHSIDPGRTSVEGLAQHRADAITKPETSAVEPALEPDTMSNVRRLDNEPGDPVVNAIAEPARAESPERGDNLPGRTDTRQKLQYRIRTNQQALGRQSRIQHQHGGSQGGEIAAVPAQDRRRLSGLQGRKPEDVVAVMAQNELHCSIAQSAQPVVEHDGIRHGGFRYGRAAGCGAGRSAGLPEPV